MAIWRLTVLPAGFASLFSIGLLAAPVAQAAEAAATASSEKEVSTKAAQGAGNASAGKGNVWHLLDVPAVVCAGAPGLAAVPFTLTGNASTPHIISVFRTSGKNATITIAVNASGSVVLPPTNVTLHGFHEDRRLSDSDADLDLQALGASGGGSLLQVCPVSGTWKVFVEHTSDTHSGPTRAGCLSTCPT